MFFELFHTGNQPKLAQGNRVRLDRLMELVQHDPDDAEGFLAWLNYCFRRRAVKSFQELALATTDFVFRWDLESYHRLVRVFLRLFASDEIKAQHRPSEEVTRRMLAYVTV